MARTRLLSASTFLLLIAGQAMAALPGEMTGHHRILYSDLIVVARASVAREEAFPRGAAYTLAVKEVLLDRNGIGDPGGRLLHDEIPGSSSFGDRLPIPGDTDVLLFLVANGEDLGYAGCWTNAMVPLDGSVEECLVPRYEFRTMTGAEFLSGIRNLAADFARFDFLAEAYRSAVGSRHPFCFGDKVPLLELALDTGDVRAAAFAQEELDDPALPESCRQAIERRFRRPSSR